jgi:hypothetical protein
LQESSVAAVMENRYVFMADLVFGPFPKPAPASFFTQGILDYFGLGRP